MVERKCNRTCFRLGAVPTENPVLRVGWHLPAPLPARLQRLRVTPVWNQRCFSSLLDAAALAPPYSASSWALSEEACLPAPGILVPDTCFIIFAGVSISTIPHKRPKLWEAVRQGEFALTRLLSNHYNLWI